MPGGGRHDQLVALAQHDQHGARVHERPAALDDQLEHAVQVGHAAHRVGDVPRRLERAHGALELQAAALAALVQAGVVDRSGRPLGEHHHGLLVLLGELSSALLLSQVQVAPGLAADHDRNAQEGPHLGVAHREPVALGVLANVGQPQGTRVVDQYPEDAASARKVANRTLRGAIDPDREEAFELLTRLVEHAERRVPGAGDLAGFPEDPVEHRLSVVLGDQVSPDAQQSPDLLAVAECAHLKPRADYTPRAPAIRRSRYRSVVAPDRVWGIADGRIEQMAQAPANATARAGTFEASAFPR